MSALPPRRGSLGTKAELSVCVRLLAMSVVAPSQPPLSAERKSSALTNSTFVTPLAMSCCRIASSSGLYATSLSTLTLRTGPAGLRCRTGAVGSASRQPATRITAVPSAASDRTVLILLPLADLTGFLWKVRAGLMFTSRQRRRKRTQSQRFLLDSAPAKQNPWGGGPGRVGRVSPPSPGESGYPLESGRLDFDRIRLRV